MKTTTFANTEIWKPIYIEGFENLYEISSQGRVRALDRLVQEVSGKTRLHKGRIITPKKTGDYLGVSLFYKGAGQRHYIHRLVAAAFIPNPFQKPCVNHINCNRHDNNVENLEWVTSKENTLHSHNLGRLSKIQSSLGEDHHSSKLTKISVRELRLSWKQGDCITNLSKKYGVSTRALYQLLRGNTWKHVYPPVAIALTGESSN